MRDIKISFIRMIAMFSIILCYFFQYYHLELAWWFNVGVQVFFVLSGWLYGGKKVDNFWKWFLKNTKKIIIPVYLYLIIFGFIFMKQINIVTMLKAFLLVSFPRGLGHLWFISYILFSYLLTYYLQTFYEFACSQKNTRYKNIFYKILLFIVIIQIIGIAYFKYFKIVWISCYIAGYFLRKLFIESRCIFKKVVFLLITLGLFLNMIQLYLQYISKMFVFNNNLKFVEMCMNYNHALLGISIFFIFYNYIARCLTDNKYLKRILNWSDKYSFYIYIVHQFYILGSVKFLELTRISIINVMFVLLLILMSGKCLFICCDKVRKIFSSQIY